MNPTRPGQEKVDLMVRMVMMGSVDGAADGNLGDTNSQSCSGRAVSAQQGLPGDDSLPCFDRDVT
jgi:hypothetical protein